MINRIGKKPGPSHGAIAEGVSG